MKLLKRFTLILLLAIVSIGCNKDDDNSTAVSLLGTWKLTGEKINGTPEQLDACELKSTLKFTDTKVTYADYDGINCEDSYTETYGYTRNGNTLKINADGELIELEISKHTSSVLEFTEVDDYDNSVYIITYAKQ